MDKYFYKQVAVVDNRFYSVYDVNVEYVLGQEIREKPNENHKGGFYVYSSIELAANAKILMKIGSNWIFPRTILKVECRGRRILYPRFKICFEYINPIEDIGFPRIYLQSLINPITQPRNTLKDMKKETEELEKEVLKMEKKAKTLGIIL